MDRRERERVGTGFRGERVPEPVEWNPSDSETGGGEMGLETWAVAWVGGE